MSVIDYIIKEFEGKSDRHLLHKILEQTNFLISKFTILMAQIDDLIAQVTDLQATIDATQAKIAAAIAAFEQSIADLQAQIAAGGAATPAQLQSISDALTAAKADLESTATA